MSRPEGKKKGVEGRRRNIMTSKRAVFLKAKYNSKIYSADVPYINTLFRLKPIIHFIVKKVSC